MDGIASTLQLNEDRYLGYAWKAGKVHSICMAVDQLVAYELAERSLRHKPTHDQVYENLAELIKKLP
ncbi:MAG: hypothetical protein ACLFTK_12590 [Anaerolineales bacterium]